MSNGKRGATILVTGATGKQGGAVARRLLERGFDVRAMTRNPDRREAAALRDLGAEIVTGDLDDRESLERATQGVDGVFSVQNFWETGYQREIDQGVALADVAKAAGVPHFVYASVASAHRNTGLSHFESKWRIENHIRDLGLPYTILRPVWFMENWEGPFLRPGILSGTLTLPLTPSRPFQQVAVDDIGKFAALAFENRDEWVGRELDLAGDERTVAEIVETFGKVIGRAVEYDQVSWEGYRQAAGDEYHDMFRWFEDVGYDADIPELRKQVQLTDFEEYLRANGWAGAEASAAMG